MEMSFESIMAVGTGMSSRENAEVQDKATVNYDGYADGLDLDIARTSEQLHFIDTYDRLQSLHSAEKFRMIKKINTAYNGKTISNANVANSVESYCNNAMSTEGVLTNIKEKLVEIFKRFCEFIKKCIMKFKMNLSKYYRLFTMKITDGLFIKDSEKLIDKLYKLNSELLVKISHASQITSDQKDAYLLIKSISDKMIQNCFNLFSIGVNDAKMLLKKSKSNMVITSYDPKGLHKKINMLIAKYDDFLLNNLFKDYIQAIDSNDKVIEIKVQLEKCKNDINGDCLLLCNAASTFKKITVYAYDEEEKIRERIEREEDAKRKEELEKEYKEFSKQMDEVIKSYVSDFEERINTSFDEVRAANDDLEKTMDKLRDLDNHADLAEQVFNKIENKFN